jgi:alpha-L-fucosidase
MKKAVTILTACMMLGVCIVQGEELPVTKTQDAVRAQQIKDLKWGMFICWSFSTFHGHEWTPTRKRGPEFFKATGVDTDQWARTAKEAGMGYILFLTKHHDGFCLWDTATTEKKVTNSPLGVDVLAELRKSCDKYGIKLALYFSEGDWTWPGSVDGKAGQGGSNPEMKKAQLKELLTRYGPIEFWWMDHAVGTGGLSHKETVEWMHQFQPDTFVGFNHGEPAGRLCLRERGKPGRLGDAGASAYNKDAEGSYKGYLVAEFTYPILPKHKGGADWFYSLPKHDNLCHPAINIYKDYQGAQKYENIFSINIGPNYEGKLRDIDVETLQTVGEMIRTDEKLASLSAVQGGLSGEDVKMLLAWLESGRWWEQRAAFKGLAPAVADPQHTAASLSGLEKAIVNTDDMQTLEFLPAVTQGLQSAPAEAQKAAADMLGRAYAAVPKPGTTNPAARRTAWAFHVQAGTVDPNTAPHVAPKLNLIAARLAQIPGGYDTLYSLSRQAFPGEALPHESIFLGANAERLNPETRKGIETAILNKLIPMYIERDRVRLTSEAALDPQATWLFLPTDGLDGLAGLFRLAGRDDYGWHPYGPARDAMQWDYLCFDPDDKNPWGPYARYREVELPAVMDNWFAVDFDAAAAGWQKGKAPFGSKAGKLEALNPGCALASCGCSQTPNTLWDKEVLLMRGTFAFPEVKPGHRYRLMIGGGNHVFRGDGAAVYINGRLVAEQKRGHQKGEGGLPRGVLLDKEATEALAKGTVTIAVKSFLLQDFDSKEIVNHLSIWLEEMKIPPVVFE